MEGGLGAQLRSPPSAAATAAARSLISKGGRHSLSVQTCKPAFQARVGYYPLLPVRRQRRLVIPGLRNYDPNSRSLGPGADSWLFENHLFWGWTSREGTGLRLPYGVNGA